MSTKNKNNNNQPTKNQTTVQIKQTQATTYSGPIPAAEEFRKYEEILPGAADRILTMAEAQATHRQELETLAVKGGLINSRIGQITGLIFFIFLITAGTFLIFWDKDVVGLISILSSVGGALTTFFYGKRGQAKEIERKRKEMQEGSK